VYNKSQPTNQANTLKPQNLGPIATQQYQNAVALQNYNSGSSMVDAATRAALIKPIGSENQLQKLSQNKIGAVQVIKKPIVSPMTRKSQIKTETNWNNNG
jgi:hypothetical protein